MAVVCDTAVLIAADRHNRRVAALARVAAEAGEDVVVPTACVAQAWRDGARQAALARFLAGCLEVTLDSAAARKAGTILAAADTSDVVDAGVAAAASSDDVVLTGDPRDIRALLDVSPASGARVECFP